MSKHFNTAGPCKADIHYMLPPTARLRELRSLIDQQNYFVIHAPQQVSKTTAMLALAQELTASGEYTKDVTQPVTDEVINRAKEILIQRQDTHLDSLAERLRENRVKAIIEPMLAGSDLPDTPEDDRRFLLDLGLVKRSPLGRLTIANPIYQEVIPRVLSQGSQDSLPQIQPTWLNTDN